MTRKDYEVVAASIAVGTLYYKTPAAKSMAWAIAREFAERAQRENANFDGRKFYIACGLTV